MATRPALAFTAVFVAGALFIGAVVWDGTNPEHPQPTAPAATPGTGSPRTTTPNPAPAGPSPAQELDRLKIAPAHPMTGYSRTRFPHWNSAGPGCDVRDVVLARDAVKVVLDGCNVTGGVWHSWYDDKTLTAPSQVDIDHLVPLADAWRSGADQWTDTARSEFANDIVSPQLTAVSASANRAKGDQDPSTWKPAVHAAWCRYATGWVDVKTEYRLTITRPEHDALATMLNGCHA